VRIRLQTARAEPSQLTRTAMARTADTPTPMPAEPAILLTVSHRIRLKKSPTRRKARKIAHKPKAKIAHKTIQKIALILLIQSVFLGLLMKLH
jgi:hypothetical protein